MVNEVKCLQDLESMLSGLAINADIELQLDNTKVVERIFQYKRMREMLDDLVFEMNDQYRAELDAYIEKYQTITVA